MMFSREKFLFRMLGAIFAWQAVIFSYAVVQCFDDGGKDACPNLGKQFEANTNLMVATTLALLTGSAVTSLSKKSKTSDDDPASASPSPVQPPQPSPRVKGRASEQEASASR